MPHPSCKPNEHLLSRRRWLGNMSGAATVGALGGLVTPTAGEVLKKKERQVLFIYSKIN